MKKLPLFLMALGLTAATAACSGNTDGGSGTGGSSGAAGASNTGGSSGAAGSSSASACHAGTADECTNTPGKSVPFECPYDVDLSSNGCQYNGEWAASGTGDAATISGSVYCCAP